jgi:manganese transport system permease protein
MSVVEVLVEPLQYEFMVRALATTTIAAVTCALLSCWLVLIGWSLMGDAVSHSVLPGVVLAYVLGAPFAIGALVFGLLAVTLIGAVRGTGRIKEDAAIGVVSRRSSPSVSSSSRSHRARPTSTTSSSAISSA